MGCWKRSFSCLNDPWCWPDYTKKEWLLLCALGGVDFASAICASLQAPFYPAEAEKKGAIATEYGLVFGIFELAVFISSPLFARHMGKLGAKFVINAGIIVVGFSSILFGLLDLIELHWWFTGVSFLVRIVEALGSSATITASIAIVFVVFKESFARIFTMLEILQGLGYIVGPTLGGYLFELGGFVCPFSVVGVFLLLNGAFILYALPDVDYGKDEGKPQAEILTTLKVTPVFLAAFSMFVEAMSVGFLSATLEPHLRKFDLSPTTVGAVFIINGATYMLLAPLVGFMSNNHENTKKMVMLGSLITIVSFMLIGPLPFIPSHTTLWVVCLGLVLDGVGMAFMFVPSFVDAIYSAVDYGLPDDITTYRIISAIYSLSFALGAFIGPSVAGVLFDTVGFRRGTLFVIAAHITLYVAMCWYFCRETCLEQDKDSVNSSTSGNLDPIMSQETDAHALTADEGSDTSALITDDGEGKKYGSTEQQTQEGDKRAD